MLGGRSCGETGGGGRGRTGVAGFAGEGHQGVAVEFAGLVVGGFEDGGSAHSGFGGGDDGEVFAG